MLGQLLNLLERAVPYCHQVDSSGYVGQSEYMTEPKGHAHGYNLHARSHSNRLDMSVGGVNLVLDSPVVTGAVNDSGRPDQDSYSQHWAAFALQEGHMNYDVPRNDII